MNRIYNWVFFLSALAIASLLVGTGYAMAGQKRAVAELFTSQGCSSCPPADRVLQQIAQQPDVLALSYHINYWDHIGWKDPYASAAATSRQRRYAEAMGAPNVFTPQMVVNGSKSLVGSRIVPIEQALQHDLAGIEHVQISQKGRTLSLMLSPLMIENPLMLWRIDYLPRVANDVPRGENAGRELHHINVVRHIEALPRPYQQQHRLSLPPKNPNWRTALLIQKNKAGSILAAYALDE